MRVWLMRHGEALVAESFGGDFGRALSERGREQVAGLGHWWKEREPLPEAIWHSPLTRAAETAVILQRELGEAIPTSGESLLAPGMSAGPLLSRIAAQAIQSVLCVGHQPDIGRALSEMIGGGRFAIPPGTIAAIEFRNVIAPGGGELRWLLAPDWF